MMSNPFSQYLSNLFIQGPLIVAYVAALVYCATRWNRNPRPAQFAFLGTTFLLLSTLAQPIINMTISTQLRGNSMVQIGQMYSITALVFSVVRGTGFGFLIAAAFVHRAQVDPATAFPFASRSPNDRAPGM